MRVLITGAAGFVGARLAKKLLDEGWDVQGIDIVPRSDASRLKGLKIDYEWASLQDIHVIDAPYVVHAAAVADVPFMRKSPVYGTTQNVLGTLTLLEAAIRHDGFERFVIQSSESVYGYARRIPIPEDEPLNPTSPYGASKASQELYAMAYFHSYKLPVTVIRSSTLYGPLMRLNQAIPIFLHQALARQPITVHGDGKQTRDLNYIDNLTDGIALALTQTEAIGQVFNIASGAEMSVLDVAEKCIAIVNEIYSRPPLSSPIVHTPQRPGEQDIRLAPDITKAKKLLGYSPRVSFDEGLDTTARWMAGLVGALTP